MRLKGRENAAAVKVMRRIAEAVAVPPMGGTAVLGEELCGDGCGVQGEGRGRGIVCLTIRDTVTVWRELCPCLNPLDSTGKRPRGPERPYGLLTFLISSGRRLPDLFIPLCPVEKRENNRAIGVKNWGFVSGFGG
jgi:hypothetical protein